MQTKIDLAETPTAEEFLKWKDAKTTKWFVQWIQLRYQSHATALIGNCGSPGQEPEEVLVRSVNNASAARQLRGTLDATYGDILEDTHILVYGSAPVEETPGEENDG